MEPTPSVKLLINRMSWDAYESPYVTAASIHRRSVDDDDDDAEASSVTVSCGDSSPIFVVVYSTCGIFLLLSAVVGPLTNVTCCYTIWTVRALHSPFNLLMSHASVVDAVMSAIGAPLLAAVSALSLVQNIAVRDSDCMRTSYAIEWTVHVAATLVFVFGAVGSMASLLYSDCSTAAIIKTSATCESISCAIAEFDCDVQTAERNRIRNIFCDRR